jgi:selenocysteine lyase/cysteine desulfurase
MDTRRQASSTPHSQHSQQVVEAVAEAIRTWRNGPGQNAQALSLSYMAARAGVAEFFARFRTCEACLGTLQRLINEKPKS